MKHQYSSKMSRPSKTRKAQEIVIAKRSLRRHDNQMQCGVLDGFLKQKKDMRLKLRESIE